MTRGLVERISQHVSTVTDRTLPRIFEIGGNHELVHVLWELDNAWIKLADAVLTTSDMFRRIQSQGLPLTDDQAQGFALLTVPRCFNEFLLACGAVANYFAQRVTPEPGSR